MCDLLPTLWLYHHRIQKRAIDLKDQRLEIEPRGAIQQGVYHRSVLTFPLCPMYLR